jgi:hypothetical protein
MQLFVRSQWRWATESCGIIWSFLRSYFCSCLNSLSNRAIKRIRPTESPYIKIKTITLYSAYGEYPENSSGGDQPAITVKERTICLCSEQVFQTIRAKRANRFQHIPQPNQVHQSSLSVE